MKINKKRDIIVLAIITLYGLISVFANIFASMNEEEIKELREHYYVVLSIVDLLIFYYVSNTPDLVRRKIEYATCISYFAMIFVNFCIDNVVLQYCVIIASLSLIVYLLIKNRDEKKKEIVPKTFIKELCFNRVDIVYYNSSRMFLIVILACVPIIINKYPIAFFIVTIISCIVITANNQYYSKKFYSKKKIEYVLEYVFIILAISLTQNTCLWYGLLAESFYNILLTMVCLIISYHVFYRKYFEREILKLWNEKLQIKEDANDKG